MKTVIVVGAGSGLVAPVERNSSALTSASLVTPMERKVHKILGRYGDDGATIFEIRKALGGDVMAGTVRNCLVGLIRKGVVAQDTFTSDKERMARDVDHCDVYRLKQGAA